MTRTLVTMALPYANGSIHLGHLVEAVQTDVYVRALKAMQGADNAVFICADDMHGTPIEVNARKAGVEPEAFVEKWHAEHKRDYAAFEIGFDHFYKTHSDENRRHAEAIFAALQKDGAVQKRPVEQFYCDVDKRFLPDRFVKGNCPKCGAPDQYGDVCESCGSTYEPTDLKSPKCALCGTPPTRRSSDHYFVRLAKYESFLREWTSHAGTLQPEIRNFVDHWLKEGLKDWDISREAPYFGFKIPGETDKYFYVWLDAPVGYLSSTEHWSPHRYRDFWAADADARVEHFIGKDIIYFHTLFWPAMLHVAGWKTPSRVHVHGMLGIEGAKMSKSRGTFINGSEYVDAGLDPEWLRYFYASNLGPAPTDIDLSFGEMKNRVNGELLNNVGNLANRALSVLAKSLDGKLGKIPADGADLLQEARAVEGRVSQAYLAIDSRAAIQEVLALSSRANERLQRVQPWKLLKDDPEKARDELTQAVNIARACARLLAPVVPRFARGVEQQTRAPLKWDDWTPLEGTSIGEVAPLVRRIEDADLKKLTDRFKPEEPPKRRASDAPAAAAALDAKPEAGSRKPEAQSDGAISIDQFALVDLRAGKVLAAEKVPKKDKLLKLTVDLGEAQPRTIVSGVAQSYQPEELVGKMVCVVANLPPREFGKGLASHGMVLYSGGGARENTALELPADVKPGAKVK